MAHFNGILERFSGLCKNGGFSAFLKPGIRCFAEFT